MTSFPEVGAARDAYILDQIRQGQFDVEYATIVSDYNGHHAEFSVFADALKVDGVRINVSAELQQQIADMTGCSLLTPKLADLMWVQRQVTLPPLPRAITSSTAAMIDQSAKIDAHLTALGNPPGLVVSVGKIWGLDNDIEGKIKQGFALAMNYGWNFEGASYQGITGEEIATHLKDPSGRVYRLIQGRGFAHNLKEVDYSQLCIMVARACKMDGADMDIHDLFQNPDLAPLASHQGVLRVLRQPGVPLPTDTTIYMPRILVTA
jgi:hypothetical protein